MMGWYGGGFPVLMGLFWLALIALIVFLVIKLLPTGGTSADSMPIEALRSPEQVLDLMFASGKIDEQTYRTRRTALNDMRGK